MRSFRETTAPGEHHEGATTGEVGKHTLVESLDATGAGTQAVGKHTPVESLQRKVVQRYASQASQGGPPDSAAVASTAEAGLTGGGRALPHQSALEAGFGVDLSDVRAHTGSTAAQASRAIGAEAYTMGSDVAFASTSPSKELVAHEVAHVIQQRSGAGPAGGVGQAGDSFEVEADAAASTVAGGGSSDLASRYSASGAGGTLQRKVVQRYESSEHAATADGMQYPIDISPLELPNHARATRGELVAFGDFYESYDAIARAPREETEALIGIIRWEGIWRLAMRRKENAPQGGGALSDPKAPKSLDTSAEPDDTGFHGGAVDKKKTTKGLLTWDDPAWDLVIKGSGETTPLRAKAQALHAQFSPSWQFFSVNVPLTTFSDNALTLQQMKLTLGRRRFRNTNNTLGSGPQDGGLDNVGAKTSPDTTNKKVSDPGNLGGDYFDLASNNLSHFAITNWSTWETYHKKVCEITRTDPGKKDRAVIEDSWGCHYLTDMFASGHTVDKQELMTSATSMVVGMSETHGLSKKGDDKHKTIENMLTESLQLAFRDEDVYKAWQDGCRNAFDQGLVRYSEMTLMLTIPRGSDWAHGQTVVGNLTKTIMGMPWRNQTDNKQPGGGNAEAFGPGNAANGKGDYHLGVGNLAALTAHNALNKIGFMASNDAGDTWRMQGDSHLTAATQAVAHKAVNESTRQAEAGVFEPQKVRDLTPRRGTIDPAWVKEYFDDRRKAGMKYDPTKMAALNALVIKASTTPIEFDSDKAMDQSATVSNTMRDLCHAIMEVEFTAAPEEFQELKDKVVEDSGGDPDNAPTGSMNNTGINISFLRLFLKDNLPRMVPAAYASASAGDLSSEALEAYAPRDNDGNVLPTGANDFQWNGSKVTFKVNVSGCQAGPVTLGIMVHDQDEGMDYLPSGQLEDEPVSRNEDEIFGPDGEVGDSKDKAAIKAATQILRITVPATAKAAANGRTYVDASFTLAGKMDHGEHYIRVFADPACTMVIGRSAPRDSGQTSNPTPADPTYKATGPDASPPPGHYAASGVDGNAFEWDGNTVRFRLSDNAPANPNATIRAWVKQFDRDTGYDYDEAGREIPTEFFEPRDKDDLIGGPTQVDASRVMVDGKAISTVVLFNAVDNDGDTYVIVYADAACARPLARSNVQGSARGKVKDNKPVKSASGISGFGWAGNTLSFRVDPPDTPKVWAKLFDKDNGFDYDTTGRLIPGARDEDEQYGGAREVAVRDGKATVAATGDADDGDTYAIVYADPGCTVPLARSGVKG
jgi:Domain of unknown function (DUF4157)